MQGRETHRREFLKAFGAGALACTGLTGCRSQAVRRRKVPNILFCISDDQSWLHTSIAGDPVVKTPSFDRIAREGVLFTSAYCASPSCAPSRSTILTGQEMWRLEEGGLLVQSHGQRLLQGQGESPGGNIGR